MAMLYEEEKKPETTTSTTTEDGTTTSSMLESLNEQVNEAKSGVEEEQNKLKEWQNTGESAYKNLLAPLKPVVNQEREDRLRRSAKAQAIMDGIAALAGGIIGASSKGYAPTIGQNAEKKALEFSNLKQVQEAQQRAYDRLKADVDMRRYEAEGRQLQADLARAQAKQDAVEKMLFSYQLGQEQLAAEKKEQENKADAKAYVEAQELADELALEGEPVNVEDVLQNHTKYLVRLGELKRNNAQSKNSGRYNLKDGRTFTISENNKSALVNAYEKIVAKHPTLALTEPVNDGFGFVKEQTIDPSKLTTQRLTNFLSLYGDKLNNEEYKNLGISVRGKIDNLGLDE